MSELRRINVCLPGWMLAEVDAHVRRGGRSAWIRSALRLYLRVKRRRELVDVMRRGYPAMGEENLRLAEVGPEDLADWASYEAFLVGKAGQVEDARP